MTSPDRSAWLWLPALAGLALCGCGAECIDKFDCTKKARAGETLTCDRGKCVSVLGLLPNVPGGGSGGTGGGAGGAAGSDAGRLDAGAADAGRDAGPTDAGRPDAGGVDAGGSDAGSPSDGGLGDAGAAVTDAGQFEAHLSPAQLVPPGAGSETGHALVALLGLPDGGTALRWVVEHGLDAGAPLEGLLGWNALAGQPLALAVALDGGWSSPARGEVAISSLVADAIALERAALELRVAGTDAGLLRGQLIRLGHRVSSAALLDADGGAQGVVQLVAPASQGVRTAGEVRYQGEWTAPLAVSAELLVRPSDGGADRTVTSLIVTASGLAVLGSFSDDGGAFAEPATIAVRAPDGGLEGAVRHH